MKIPSAGSAPQSQPLDPNTQAALDTYTQVMQDLGALSQNLKDSLNDLISGRPWNPHFAIEASNELLDQIASIQGTLSSLKGNKGLDSVLGKKNVDKLFKKLENTLGETKRLLEAGVEFEKNYPGTNMLIKSLSGARDELNKVIKVK